MDGPFPLILITALLTTMLGILALWGWRHFARTSRLDARGDRAAVVLATSALRLADGDGRVRPGGLGSGAGAPKTRSNLSDRMTDVPAMIVDGDPERDNTQSSTDLPQLKPVQTEQREEQAELGSFVPTPRPLPIGRDDLAAATPANPVDSSSEVVKPANTLDELLKADESAFLPADAASEGAPGTTSANSPRAPSGPSVEIPATAYSSVDAEAEILETNVAEDHSYRACVSDATPANPVDSSSEEATPTNILDELPKAREGVVLPAGADTERRPSPASENSRYAPREPSLENPVAAYPGVETEREMLEAGVAEDHPSDAGASELSQLSEQATPVSGSNSLSSETREEIEPRESDSADHGTDPATIVETVPERPKQPAVHRDRRGKRRIIPTEAAPAEPRATRLTAAARPAAEAKLRLMLHPIRRAATLSAVLARPAGYPDRITLLLNGRMELSAYSEERYDDADLEWTADLLSNETRLDCKEGYQWLRSSRRIHIFGEVADEPGLISVGSAALASQSTIVCLSEDAPAVRQSAEACGSPALVSHNHWAGIPDGWAVLSGYRPSHAATSALAPSLTGLDPGVGSEIRVSGGLQIRSTSFAEGSPPRIEILPFPPGATVAIDGQPASLGEDGAWRADGWDTPGDHLVDVVPGPSATYRILEDPWSKDGWEPWDAHPDRFGSLHVPWNVARICGAAVSGPADEYVVAADAMLSVVCLGVRRGAVMLRGRPDAPVAVGLLSEPPGFLISTSGPRRHQGRVAWLNPAANPSKRRVDPEWVAVVRSASSRRLPVEGGGPAEDAWRSARERARRHRKPRS